MKVIDIVHVLGRGYIFLGEPEKVVHVGDKLRFNDQEFNICGVEISFNRRVVGLVLSRSDDAYAIIHKGDEVEILSGEKKFQAMTEKEKRFKAELRNIGKHLHKNEYMPINLANHPMQLRSDIHHESVTVNWGWAARNANGVAFIDFDDLGNPKPYEGFWEAKYYSC